MIRSYWDLYFAIVFPLLLILIVILGDIRWLQYVRLPLTAICLLFLTDYSVICVVLPGKDSLGQLERFVLSFAFSIVIVSFIGFVLNFTPWGVRLFSCLISISIFIVTASLLALYRRKKLPPQQQYIPFDEITLTFCQEQPVLTKVAAPLAVLAVSALLIFCFAAISSQQPGERYTEFYILDEYGLAENYPRVLEVGKKEKLIAGVVNHEQKTVSYFLTIKMKNIIKSTKGPIVLEHGEKWEDTVEFTAYQQQEKVKVEFLLYRELDRKPYRTVYLWVTVK